MRLQAGIGSQFKFLFSQQLFPLSFFVETWSLNSHNWRWSDLSLLISWGTTLNCHLGKRSVLSHIHEVKWGFSLGVSRIIQYPCVIRNYTNIKGFLHFPKCYQDYITLIASQTDSVIPNSNNDSFRFWQPQNWSLSLYFQFASSSLHYIFLVWLVLIHLPCMFLLIHI